MLCVNKKDVETYWNDFIDKNDNVGKIEILIAKLKKSENLRRQRRKEERSKRED